MPYGSSYKSGSGLGAEQPVTPVRQSSSYTSSAQVSPTLPDKTIEENRSTTLNSENAPIQFPSDLGTDYYISFNAFKHEIEKPEDTRRSFSFKKSINLPLPTNLSDNYSADYNSENLYFVGNALKQGLTEFSSGPGGIIGGFENLNMNSAGKKGAEALNYLANNKGNIAAAAGVMALGGMGGPMGAAAKAAFQVTANPFPVMIFQGTRFKPPFTFDWTLYPESREEAVIIRNIVGFFRREMLPETYPGNPAILKTPSVFEIKMTPELSLRKFKRCVLTNMNVNYAPSGVSFLNDVTKVSDGLGSDPTATSISLTFQEIEIWLADDYGTSEETQFRPIE